MKKNLLFILVAFLSLKTFAQQAPYVLPLPEKWGVEKINFPISFAPKIPFKGNEEIRFTPGWGNENSDEYWSYTFVWFIEGVPTINADILKDDFTQYFDGLYKTNDKKKTVAADASFTKPKFEKVKTATNEQETYEGKISTINFLNGKPLELLAVIHVRNYPGSNHSVLLIEFSPKAYDQPVWQSLNGIVDGFQYKL